RLAAAPRAFTLVAFLPFGLAAAALGVLVRRELGSTTAALASVAAFSLSSLYVETAWWYSASSFAWAAAWTLVTLLAAGRRRTIGAGLLASLGALLAPSCSAIGLLAGPLGAVRVLAGTGRLRSRVVAALGPLAGTALYLAIGGAFRYRDVVAGSVRQHADFPN